MDTAVSNGIGSLIDRAVSIYSPTPSAIITKPFLTNIIELDITPNLLGEISLYLFSEIRDVEKKVDLSSFSGHSSTTELCLSSNCR